MHDREATGWDVLDAAVAAVADGHPPVRVAPVVRPPAERGVLHGMSAHRAADRWHLLTYGLGSLGHELTLTTPPSPEPPGWGFDLLLAVARTCVTVGRPLHAGARLAPGAPVDGAGSGLVAVAVREDPLVPAVGDLALLQCVGITRGEHALMGRTSTAVVLARLAERDPLLRTDPARA